MNPRPTEPRLVTDAESRYGGEWTGTTVADQSLMKDSGDLYELAGVDRERWIILGADIYGFSHGKEPSWSVHFYAANREDLGVGSFEDWSRVAAEHGGIPVVDILAHDVTLDDFVKCMKSVHLSFLGQNTPPLRVTHVGDNPEQTD